MMNETFSHSINTNADTYSTNKQNIDSRNIKY